MRERERGNLELLIATPVSPWELMVGKILPFVGIGLVQTTVVLVLGDVLFDVPLRGSLLDLYLAALVFIIGEPVARPLHLDADAHAVPGDADVVLHVPAADPAVGLHVPVRRHAARRAVVAEVLPLTHFLRLIRGIMLRGAGLTELWPSLAALGAFIAVMLVIAVSRVRKRLD